MIRAVVFDFDGTLVDSNTIKHECFFEVARHLPGSETPLAKILADPDAGDRHAVFAKLALHYQDRKDVAADAEALAESYTQLCELKVVNAPEMKGASQVLQTLQSEGMHLSISSATPQDTLRRIVKARGLSAHFDEVLGKPREKTEHIAQILQQLDTDPSRLAYVGDSEIDQQSARSAGCHFIGVGKNCERFQTRPQYLAEEMQEIPTIIMHIRAVFSS